MKKLILSLLLGLFSCTPAFASPPTPLCYQLSPGVCSTVGTGNGLPISIYDSGNHAGFCYISNGSGLPATFQACSAGGSVSVTAGTPDIVINPTPGTSTFTVGTTELINAQTGTTYAVQTTDMGKTITTSNAASVAVSLSAATTSGFGAGTSFSLINIGAGTATITPTTSTINGNSSLALSTGQSAYIISNGTNYFAFLGAASGSSLVVGSTTISSGTSTRVLFDNAGTLGEYTISGTGNVAMTTNGVFTTPNLGTPSAINLTNATSLPTSALPSNQIIRSLLFVIDGNGSAITTGYKGTLLIPFACTITSASLIADQSGSVTIDIWEKAFASSLPTIANTITASDLPTLSSAITEQDTTLTGWTTSVSANNMIGFNVNSASTVTRVTVALKCTAS